MYLAMPPLAASSYTAPQSLTTVKPSPPSFFTA